MQIDFGGVGKEYAVDRAVRLVAQAQPGLGVLVNFGGDLAICGVRRGNRPWSVGIEAASRSGKAVETIAVRAGGIATSGDAHRFVQHEGRRYSHILDARTGWPVEGAPRAITVLGNTCTEAGTLTTLASLKGEGAGSFLAATGARFWLQ
jgi:thiamine biosynthesis lipoprotein